MTDQELLAILACPQCKGALSPRPAQAALVCEPCALVFEIREGVPVMLLDEARPRAGRTPACTSCT